jgi:hypothetical protein
MHLIPNSRFDRQVCHGNKLADWNIIAGFLKNLVILPWDGNMCPAMRESNELFPHPERPSMHTNSFFEIVRLHPIRAEVSLVPLV